MEAKQKNKQKERLPIRSKEEKVLSKTINETDSSISMTFDSAADCGYKSEEFSVTRSSTSEHLSSLSLSELGLQLSKSDQNLRFDSGLGTDCTSPLSSESYITHEDTVESTACEPVKQPEKLVWKDIFSQDKDGDTILHLAVVEARSDIVFPLIRLAPHPDFLDICNDLYQTPLHLATLTGKSNIVRRLIVAGATLDIQDHGGNIPLHIACRSGDLDCVQTILMPITEAEVQEAQCSYLIYIQDNDLSHLINMKNYDGQSCVHLAASGGFKKVLECLYSHKANIDEQDGKSGRTALHYAVENENLELVRLLLSKCNANPHVRNYAGQTSFCVAWALRRKNPSNAQQAVLNLLKEYADKWDSTSEFESDSSSDEADFIDTIQRNCKEVATTE